MNRCEYTEVCPFFTDEVGYSIDMFAHMRLAYCLGDSGACARLIAIEFMPAEEVPDDLLPTDMERLEELRAERS